MLIFYILFTLFCCCLTAFLVENHMVSILKEKDTQNLELFNQLGDYIVENKKQIQKNIQITNALTNRVFYNK